MDTAEYKSAIAKTINNLMASGKQERVEQTQGKNYGKVDMGAFTVALKKEMLNLKLPLYSIHLGKYRNHILVLELPFCKSSEIAVEDVDFGSEQKQVILYLDKKPVRRIKLQKTDAKYMERVAVALVDYFKRFLVLKNKFDQ